MKDEILLRMSKLLAVKSMVTLVLTGVFAYLAASGQVTSSDFLTIFLMVISFYFGAQTERGAIAAQAAASSSAAKEAGTND